VVKVAYPHHKLQANVIDQDMAANSQDTYFDLALLVMYSFVLVKVEVEVVGTCDMELIFDP